jgi:flagellar biogenesis protein FliO
VNSAADLVMVARVAGSLIVVLVVVALAARMARRGRWHRAEAGLRVVDRTGLTRDASVAVVEVGDKALVLGVTPHGVSVLTVLDSARLDPAGDDDADDDPPAGRRGRRSRRQVPPPSSRAARPEPRDLTGATGPAVDDDAEDVAPEGFPLAGGERLSPEDFGRIVEEAGQRLFGRAGYGPDRDLGLLPEALRMDQYPDLASALRAAGRVQQPARPAVPRQAAAERRPPPAKGSPSRTPSAQSPTTQAPRAQTSRAEAPRARATGERGASGSVLDPATWRQGLEALRDLTARKG